MGFLRTAISLVATITLALAADDPTINVYNECSVPVWIQSTTFGTSGGTAEFTTGEGFTQLLDNLGNSVGVALESTYYATTTPKLIFGFSVDATSEILYYSVTTEDGNPFASMAFTVTGTDSACTTITSPNGVTYACPATASLSLTLC